MRSFQHYYFHLSYFDLILVWMIVCCCSPILVVAFRPMSNTAVAFHNNILSTEPATQQQQRMQKRFPRRSNTMTGLRSSPDEDPEWIEDDDSDRQDIYRDSLLYVSPEPFESEASVATAANQMAAAASSTSSTNGGYMQIELQKEVETSFLQYALSIILGRALPDARDGLKPVHRRILYSMHQLNLSPTLSHRKCARVVGEVLGKYHPHGDMAVYDALVRMAQDFSTNYRLIDGHGNFGSVDADPAAAMRYTECRLTHLATQTLLQDITENTVDFNPNFDGNEMEPSVLPARLPVLLLNGSSGIAVGMATNIPPHNLREILRASTALVNARIGQLLKGESETVVSDEDLCRIVPGPDFPTGASIMGTEGAKKLYTTGNGGVVMRAVTEIEQVNRGGSNSNKSQTTRTAIIVKELPYQVNKAALLEKMADLVNDKKLEGIADLRDESDRDGIRVVLELKRDAVPAIVLNNLYKKTALQTSFSGNFLALMSTDSKNVNDDDDYTSLTPKRFTLREALDYFLDFRFKTIRRKSAYQLSKVVARMHIVDGLLLALGQLDRVIDLIRTAPDQGAVRKALMDPKGLLGGLSQEQADALLRLQLGQLTRLSQGKLSDEKQELEDKQAELRRLLEHDEAVYNVMLEEFTEMDQRFGVERKTKILFEDGEVNEIDMIKNSQSVVVVTRGGYIKRMPLLTFESQGRGTRGKRGTSGNLSSDDEVAHVITCNDHDTLLMIAQNGIAYSLRAYQVPTASRTAKGSPIPSVLPISTDQVITSVLPVSEFKEDEYIVLATERGWIKKTPLDAFEKTTSRGLTIASLEDGDKLKWCSKCTDKDDILMGTSLGMATRFEASKLRPTGRTSRGVRAMKLKDGDTIADMNILDRKKVGTDEFVLCVTSNGFGKRVSTSEFRATGRGLVGVIAIKFKKGGKQLEDDRLSCFCVVKEEDEFLLNTAKGVMVRQQVTKIPSQSRSATGVVIQKVDSGDKITSVSVLPKTDEIDAEMGIVV